MSVSTCSQCHRPLAPGDEICERCGAVLASIPAMTAPATTSPAPPPQSASPDVCPKCNTARRPDKKFCGQCGYRFPPGRGETLGGKYRLEKMLGSGGMGAVWLAEDSVLHRKVVIKALLNNDDPELVEQSVKEREFLARLNHGNIVSIYDCIAQGNEGYINMEYIHGKTLETLLEERKAPFPVPEAISSILDILPAFAYLAKLNMAYCDFKPSNILIEMREDGVQTSKLIDLGTVTKYGPKPDRVYGTHGFYAREAVKSPSPQTDLYSICRTLAFLVTLMDIDAPMFGLPQQDEYPEFQQYPALYRLLYKGTHSDPARRFQSAEELEEQLKGVLRLCAGGASGVVFETRKEWGKAEQVYKELLIDLPGEIPPLQALARVYAQQGRIPGAIQLYEDVLIADPGNVDTLFAIADCLLKQQRWDDAIRHLNNISEASSRYIDAQVLLCDIYVHRALPALPNEADIAKAAAIVSKLKGHIADARYYLWRAEVYYLAWHMARQGLLSANVVLTDAAHPSPRGLGEVAESSYRQYLRSDVPLAPREEIIRRKCEVTSWHF